MITRSYPRSLTRMKATTDPSWASDRIFELEAERDYYREALFWIDRDYGDANPALHTFIDATLHGGQR